MTVGEGHGEPSGPNHVGAAMGKPPPGAATWAWLGSDPSPVAPHVQGHADSWHPLCGRPRQAGAAPFEAGTIGPAMVGMPCTIPGIPTDGRPGTGPRRASRCAGHKAAGAAPGRGTGVPGEGAPVCEGSSWLGRRPHGGVRGFPLLLPVGGLGLARCRGSCAPVATCTLGRRPAMLRRVQALRTPMKLQNARGDGLLHVNRAAPPLAQSAGGAQASSQPEGPQTKYSTLLQDRNNSILHG